MTEGKRFSFILEHGFDKDFCPEGEHKVRPYIGFVYQLDFDYYDIPKNLWPLTYYDISKNF